eukprot:448092-Prymnesium_polylepis.1
MHGGRWMVRAGEAAALHEKVQCYRMDAGYNLDSALPEAMAASSVKTTALAVRSCHAFVIDEPTLACMCALLTTLGGWFPLDLLAQADPPCTTPHDGISICAKPSVTDAAAPLQPPGEQS